MSASREQTILAEVLARLTGSPLGPITMPSGLSVDRSHLRELAPSQLPAISIYPLEASTERKGAVSESVLTVKIVLWVQGAAGTPVDLTSDPLWQWVHQQLITDESLGGLTIRVEPAQKIWGFNLHQAPFGDLDLHYRLTFRHQSLNPCLAG